MTCLDGSAALPVIDVAPLAGAAAGAAAAVHAPVTAEALAVAGQIQAACRERGLLYVTGHGVPAALAAELAGASAEFFAHPAGALVPARTRHGRPLRLLARAVAAALLCLLVLALVPGPPSGPAVVTGPVIWFIFSARGDLAPPPGR
jgi:hypothetical protein